MLMEKERLEVIEYGKKLLSLRLTQGTSGNISVCDRETGYFAITPSGMDYMTLEPEDIAIVDLNGNQVDGRKKPSSEIHLHSLVYKNRPDVDTVVHAHSVYCTTIACLREDLPAVDYMIAVAGKEVKCAEYATFGTKELAVNAVKALGNNRAVLLANHGVLTCGNGLKESFNILEEVEYVAELYYRSRCIGKPVILDDEEMSRMLVKFETYGKQ